MHGFVENQKEHVIIVSALILACNIPDSNVTLPTEEGGPTFITSTIYWHIQYVVQNRGEFLATCACMYSQHGNICKHQAKVFRLLHVELAEGTIAKFCGSLKGTTTVCLPVQTSLSHDIDFDRTDRGPCHERMGADVHPPDLDMILQNEAAPQPTFSLWQKITLCLRNICMHTSTTRMEISK